jgi:hypothetical protein
LIIFIDEKSWCVNGLIKWHNIILKSLSKYITFETHKQQKKFFQLKIYYNSVK